MVVRGRRRRSVGNIYEKEEEKNVFYFSLKKVLMLNFLILALDFILAKCHASIKGKGIDGRFLNGGK